LPASDNQTQTTAIEAAPLHRISRDDDEQVPLGGIGSAEIIMAARSPSARWPSSRAVSVF
jgi:hypothetical protein